MRLALFVASYYGALSDRKGRKVVLKIAGLGNILMTGAYIITMKYQNIFGISLLFVAPVLRGLLAGDSVISAAIQSYISDCTTSAERTVVFGHMVSALYLGAAIGPSAASLIIKQTGTIMSIFYVVLFINILFELFVFFILPESHDFEQFKQPPKEQKSFFQRINIFSALHILVRTSSKHANQDTLLLVAGVTFLFSMVALPPTLLYAMLKFHWTAYEGGLFISLSSFCKLAMLVVFLPLISKLFHKDRAYVDTIKIDLQEEEEEASTSQVVEEPSDSDIRHAILFDAWMIRTGLTAETICYIIFGLVTTSRGFTFAAILQSSAALSLPSLRSIMTKLVSSNEIGELMGAMAILESCASKLYCAYEKISSNNFIVILSQLTINTIYSASVGTMPQLTFFVCAGISFLAVVLAFFVKPSPNRTQDIQA